jgi:hypothetical protein
MRERFWQLPGIRHLSPIWQGAVKCGLLVLGVALCLAPGFLSLRPPFAEADTLAQVGAAFMIAYGVEMSWVVRATSERSRRYEDWIGFTSCLAFCGLLGTIVALAVADSRDGASTLGEIGLAWSCAAIVLLGAVVACTPALSYEWRRQLMTETQDD